MILYDTSCPVLMYQKIQDVFVLLFFIYFCIKYSYLLNIEYLIWNYYFDLFV